MASMLRILIITFVTSFLLDYYNRGFSLNESAPLMCTLRLCCSEAVIKNRRVHIFSIFTQDALKKGKEVFCFLF